MGLFDSLFGGGSGSSKDVSVTIDKGTDRGGNVRSDAYVSEGKGSKPCHFWSKSEPSGKGYKEGFHGENFTTKTKH